VKLFLPNENGSSSYADFINAYLRNRAEWNISPAGVVFNFDQCTMPDCAHGAPSVTIPFTDVQDILRNSTLALRLVNNRR
jgi:hypothetical protein